MSGILVTGGAGYIGSHMCHLLCDEGTSVVTIDDLSTGYKSNLPKGALLVEGDISDEVLVLKTLKEHKISSIIHFAAKIVVPDSVADPMGYYLANTVKTRALLASAQKGGVEHIIFSSTAAVYGNPEENPVSEGAYLRPMSPYGASKMMSEMMLRDLEVAHGVRHIILRYFNVAGADPMGRTGQSMPNATHLIKVAVQTALGLRESMSVFGTDYPTHDGTCVRDYIHVSDLVGAHKLALEYLQKGGSSRTLNCGYGEGFSVLDVIDMVKRVSGVDFKVHLSPRREGDPAAIVAKADDIRQHLNWRPKYNDLKLIVEHALKWERLLVKSN